MKDELREGLDQIDQFIDRILAAEPQDIEAALNNLSEEKIKGLIEKARSIREALEPHLPRLKEDFDSPPGEAS